jgi:peptidoglycan/LPS O-acetylase OafA/YrhL
VAKSEFLPRIEAMRGIAALTVVVYHVRNLFSDLPHVGWLDGLVDRLLSNLSNGRGAVVAFFVISGFVLARSLDANLDPARFFRNRLFRLFPAAISVVILLTALHYCFGIYVGYEASFDLFNVILNVLMIKSDINGVMWSMTVECFATPLIFASVWIVQRRGVNPLWTIVGLLFALSFWGAYVHLLGDFTTLAGLYAFVVGVIIHFRGAQIAAATGPKWAGSVALLSIATFCISGTHNQSGIVTMLECLSAASLVILIVWHPALTIFKPLDFRIVRFYGRISYSLYLLHMLGISLALRIWTPLGLHTPGNPVSLVTILGFVIAVLLTTPAAYLSWRYIEVPAVQFGKRFGRTYALKAFG